MTLSRAGVANEEHVLVMVNELTSSEFKHRHLVHAWTSGKVEALQGLDRRKTGSFESSLCGFALTF